MFITLSRIKLTIIGTQTVMAIPVKVTNIAIVQYVAIFLFKGFLLQSWFLFMIFRFQYSFFCYDLVFFTYTSSKLEVLNNNDYCSKSVASSLRYRSQFFKTQLKIPRNRCATFFKRLGDTYKHTLHSGRFCHKLSKKYEVRFVLVTAEWPTSFMSQPEILHEMVG